MDVAENAEGSLDPRIQIELENLNNATDDINKLETELDEAHTAFRQLLSDTTRRLKEIADKLGNGCIEKARCYYEALEIARQAQVQCQQQAQLFQRASEIHAAAKETVALAEARFMSHQHEWNFDQAWQDMLNHATIKVMDAENQKAECGREHHRRAMLFHEAEKKLLQLEEKHRRSIIKARPYFEVKTQCDQMLATQKERVEYLQQTVKDAKRNYAKSLRTLEEISNQIHQQRRDYDIVVNGPREPGVGAELITSNTCQKCENDLNGPDLKVSSIIYNESGSNEKLHNIKKSCSTKEDAEHLDKRSVDGSESRFTQWELELQASMEKLNRLSVKNSGKQDNARSFTDLRDTVNIITGSCYDLLPAKQSNIHSSNQFSKFTKYLEVSKRDECIDEHSDMQKSCSTTQSMIIPCNKSKVVSKDIISKSLTSSPVNRNTSDFKNRRITEKVGSEDRLKYVPTRISQFNIKDRRTQSSWNINYSQYMDDATNKEQREYNYSNTNDILVSKSHIQCTNPSYEKTSHNIEFLPAESNLSARYHSATSINNDRQRSLDSQTLSDSNITQEAVLYGARLNSMKLKNNLLMSSAKSSDSKVTDHFNERSIPKQFINKTFGITELPLLSFFGRTSALSDIKGKSCSMIDLATRKNTKIVLDNSHLGNIQALSAERLATVRHKLVNDYPEIRINDTKK